MIRNERKTVINFEVKPIHEREKSLQAGSMADR